MRNSRLMIGLFVMNILTATMVLSCMFFCGMLEDNVKSFAPVGLMTAIQVFIALILLFRKNRMNPSLWFHVIVYWVLVLIDFGHLFLTKKEYFTLNILFGLLISIYHLAINYSSIRLFKERKRIRIN